MTRIKASTTPTAMPSPLALSSRSSSSRCSSSRRWSPSSLRVAARRLARLARAPPRSSAKSLYEGSSDQEAWLMSQRAPVLPHLDSALFNARHQYLERYGSALVMNSYLKLVIVCLVLVASGLLYLNVRTLHVVQDFQPLVVRIDELGRAEPVRYDANQYEPQAPELRYFLTQFVIKHFSRMRATVERDFSDSLYFLDQSLARAIIRAHRQHGTVEQFLRSGDPEIEVLVDNVALEDTRTPPFKASVDYTKVYYQRDTRQELRRARYTGNFVFVLRTPVPNSLIPYNPLGFTITYFREDEAFADTSDSTR
ncbi:MAG: hypothetical protein GEU99_23455 [Luteitalea sp.]|nr:hypothetical protein [Luteitalea sp.]